MWVMLLWALTLPGHEIAVYSFLIDAFSGNKSEDLVACQEGFNRAADVQNQVVYVFLDAEASSARAFLQQSVKCLQPIFNVAFLCSKSLLTYPGHFDWFGGVPLFLPVSLLPNAP